MDFVALRFSGTKTRGENIYRAMAAAEGAAFDLTPGTYEEARLYATAMGLARARYCLERAQNQTDPLKAIELLPQLEHDWGVVPREIDGVVARQNRLAVQFILAKGALQTAMESALRKILGSDFLVLIPIDQSLATVDEDLALFTNPKLPFKVIRISPVTVLGVPFVVNYTNADNSEPLWTVDVGDKFVVEPENSGLREIVEVTDSDPVARTFTAVFANAHDDQAFATTQNWCGWTSTKRSFWIVVTSAAAVDSEKRRLVDEFMTKAARGVSTWAIVEPTTPGAQTIGPFTLDSSPLGAVPLGLFPISILGGGGGGGGPHIDSVTPTFSDPAGGTYMEIVGAGFTGATAVSIGGVAMNSFVVVSDTLITGFSGPHTPSASPFDIAIVIP